MPPYCAKEKLTDAKLQSHDRERRQVRGKRSGLLRVFSVCLAMLPVVGGPKAQLVVGLFSLRAAAIQAFAEYVAKTEAQSAETLRQGPFLWVDGLQGKEQSEASAKLKVSGAVLLRVSVKNDGEKFSVPGGLIHDWKGIVFVPGAKIDEVLRILQDYDHHATYYAPDVEKSRIEAHRGDNFRVFMRFRRQKVVTVVLNTEHEVKYYRDSPLRAHSRSSAVRIAQVEDPGGSREKEKKPGEDDGYLWRMETWWRLEERDGGVYVQNQVVTLTRDIPTGLAWLIEPFITNIPKETLEFTLQATRKAVLSGKRN